MFGKTDASACLNLPLRCLLKCFKLYFCIATEVNVLYIFCLTIFSCIQIQLNYCKAIFQNVLYKIVDDNVCAVFTSFVLLMLYSENILDLNCLTINLMKINLNKRKTNKRKARKADNYSYIALSNSGSHTSRHAVFKYSAACLSVIFELLLGFNFTTKCNHERELKLSDYNV